MSLVGQQHKRAVTASSGLKTGRESVEAGLVVLDSQQKYVGMLLGKGECKAGTRIQNMKIEAY